MYSIAYGFEGASSDSPVSFQSGAVVVASAPVPTDDTGAELGSGGAVAKAAVASIAPHSGTRLGGSNAAGTSSAIPFCVGTVAPDFIGGDASTPNDALLAAFNVAADAALEWSDFYGIYSNQLPYLALMMSTYTPGAPAINSLSFWYAWTPVAATGAGPVSIPIVTLAMPNSPDTISLSGPNPADGTFDQLIISWNAAGRTATAVAPAIASGTWTQIAVDAQGKVTVAGVDYIAPIPRAWSPAVAMLYPASSALGRVAAGFDDVVVNYGDDLAASANPPATKVTQFAPIR